MAEAVTAMTGMPWVAGSRPQVLEGFDAVHAGELNVHQDQGRS